MGLGGASFRRGNDVRDVDHAYLGVWRATVLARVGGFNDAMDANEDAELSARIRALGYSIRRAPLPCRFIMNKGPWGSIRQWNRYGYWRAKMLLNNPGFVRARHVINPLAAVIGVALAISPLRPFLLPLFAAYGALVFRGRQKGEPFIVTVASLVYFPVLQFAFAMGLLGGLITGGGNVRRALDERIAIGAD
jgi:GT2 family glycosyltransferase